VRRDPGEPAFDPDKPRGWAGGALTPEYKAVFEPNLRDLAAGGEGLWPGYKSVHVLYLKIAGLRHRAWSMSKGGSSAQLK
jgi:hypothetical protein